MGVVSTRFLIPELNYVWVLSLAHVLKLPYSSVAKLGREAHSTTFFCGLRRLSADVAEGRAASRWQMAALGAGGRGTGRTAAPGAAQPLEEAPADEEDEDGVPRACRQAVLAASVHARLAHSTLTTRAMLAQRKRHGTILSTAARVSQC